MRQDVAVRHPAPRKSSADSNVATSYPNDWTRSPTASLTIRSSSTMEMSVILEAKVCWYRRFNNMTFRRR